MYPYFSNRLLVKCIYRMHFKVGRQLENKLQNTHQQLSGDF